MKLASYNVMSGGFADYNLDTAMPERLPLIQRAVTEIDADVIGLIDTFRWDKLFTDQQLTELFNYQYIARTNLNDERLMASGGESVGLVLMSRQSWHACKPVRLANRDALMATFIINNREVDVFLAYLDDISEQTRLGQIQVLTRMVGGNDSAVIMGDLNTIAPRDQMTAAQDLEQFYGKNPALKKALGAITADMLRGEVVTLLESQEFHDAGALKGSTIPSKLFPGDASQPFLRIDYCFAKNAKISDFAVHTTEDFQFSSDHFPISFEVE